MKSLRHIVPTLAVLTLAVLLSGCGKKSTPTGVQLDETPPAAPSQVAQNLDPAAGGVILDWTPSASPNVAGYQVLLYSPSPERENAYELVGETDANTTHYLLPSVTETTVQYYRVRAVTGTGIRSEWSPVALVTLEGQGGSGDTDGPRLPKPRNP